MMSNLEYAMANTAWVSEDGSFGTGQVVLFNPILLTERQWAILDNLPDSKKIRYVWLCLHAESYSEALDELETEYSV